MENGLQRPGYEVALTFRIAAEIGALHDSNSFICPDAPEIVAESRHPGVRSMPVAAYLPA
jgi:hypothetical protein